MKVFYATLADLLAQGLPVAVATIVETKGSTPREVGAKMIVRPDGQTYGSIGGGCGEAEVKHHSLLALNDGQPRLVETDLTEEVTSETEKACGGVMRLFVEPWTDKERPLAEGITHALENRRPAVLATLVTAEAGFAKPGSKLLIAEDRCLGTLGSKDLNSWARTEARKARATGPRLVTHSRTQVRVFIDIETPPPSLLIAGGGHIAVPLAQMGSMLHFRVTVIDDRPTFASRERFPAVDEVVAGDFAKTLARLPIDETTFIVIITRGHAHDMDCLRQVLDSKAAYIGMIGSRKRVKGVFRLLAEKGHSEELIKRVHAPIGLDIGAVTPAEIATAIMAEIIQIRRGGSGESLMRKAS